MRWRFPAKPRVWPLSLPPRIVPSSQCLSGLRRHSRIRESDVRVDAQGQQLFLGRKEVFEPPILPPDGVTKRNKPSPSAILYGFAFGLALRTLASERETGMGYISYLVGYLRSISTPVFSRLSTNKCEQCRGPFGLIMALSLGLPDVDGRTRPRKW